MQANLFFLVMIVTQKIDKWQCIPKVNTLQSIVFYLVLKHITQADNISQGKTNYM